MPYFNLLKTLYKELFNWVTFQVEVPMVFEIVTSGFLQRKGCGNNLIHDWLVHKNSDFELAQIKC